MVQGDTDLVAFCRATFGSRSIAVGGPAIGIAADRMIAKGRAIAAHLMEADAGDVVFEDGRFSVAGTDRSLPFQEVVRIAFAAHQLPEGMEPGLDAVALLAPKAPTYPKGCHVCEVEVDPETGATAAVRYLVVDDVGTVLDHALLAGQVHGGVAQGLGQALLEGTTYEPGSGQLHTASFMDYGIPRAVDMPPMDLHANPQPTQTNPLGAKGGGEAGTIGAPPAIINALVDALRDHGVRHVEMPATPERVWRALRNAQALQGSGRAG
ncbi:xanthine dehydrogenase family protein molybdopterin-binding subunit [Muricoccus radiodurans]|uniref:xanthine dehydrogenase family protein molybdopterin-binding subunit n=1 Tax=Muricoccus radiodurans TaxID=2231721 RepID=UPI003CEE1468